MNIMGAAAQAAAKAAAEAARRAAEAARKAAEAAARQAAAAAAAAAAQQAAQAAQKAQQAAAAKDVKKAITQDLSEAAAKMSDGAQAIETLGKQAEGKLTCAAANKQMAMKENNPAEHDRIVRDLKEHGEATTDNGEKLFLSAKNEAYIAKQEISEPEKNDLRLQAALMDYASPTEEYDLAADVSRGADGSTSRGVNEQELANLDNLDNSTETANATMTEVAAAVDVGLSVVTGIFGGGVKSHAEALADRVGDKLENAEEERANLTIALQLDEDVKHAVTVVSVNDKANTVTVKDTERTYTLTNEEFDAAHNTQDCDVGNTGTMAGTSYAAPPTRRR
jgi:hypothetical protein